MEAETFHQPDQLCDFKVTWIVNESRENNF